MYHRSTSHCNPSPLGCKPPVGSLHIRLPVLSGPGRPHRPMVCSRKRFCLSIAAHSSGRFHPDSRPGKLSPMSHNDTGHQHMSRARKRSADDRHPCIEPVMARYSSLPALGRIHLHHRCRRGCRRPGRHRPVRPSGNRCIRPVRFVREADNREGHWAGSCKAGCRAPRTGRPGKANWRNSLCHIGIRAVRPGIPFPGKTRQQRDVWQYGKPTIVNS